MSTAVSLADPLADGIAGSNAPDGLHRIDGHLCRDCRFLWVCRLLPRQLTYLDPDTSPSLGESARAFVESAHRIASEIRPEPDHGNFSCLICATASTGGYKAVVLIPA